jgi:pimeloyl-ACP methyl ester carboxylesterase
MRERYVDSAGVKIHVVEDGPESGSPVLFLHGFPEFWYSWRHQMQGLAARGFRAVAMDLRGFGESDAPDHVDAYALPASFADADAVLDTLGGRAAIVSHDWGGALGWIYAAFFPQRVERLVVLNAPHPSTYTDVLRHLPQLQASWYMFFFQFEGVAEEALSRNGFELFKLWFYDTARVPLPAEDVARYVDSFARPGRLTAGLNWYRANVRPESRLADPVPIPPVTCPAMLLWGLDDPYLTFELARRSGEHVHAPFALQAFADTGHWIQQERPQLVTAQLVTFLEARL